MPLFTKENAAEKGRKGASVTNALLKQRKAAALAFVELSADRPAVADESRRSNRIQRQIEKIDDLLDDCRDVDAISKLVNAKDKLWNLLFPKAGVLKPRSGGQVKRAPQVG